MSRMFSTLLGVQSWVRFCQQEFGEFPWLVGRYCSYLLPKQARGTPQILVDKTSPMTGHVYVGSPLGYAWTDFIIKVFFSLSAYCLWGMSR